MALTPADFAAYSRATGAPYPEDPEEKAALAPEVLQFRQNQLRAPQQESNPLAALGTAALGLGALAGGVALARRFGAGAAKIAASKEPVLTSKGVQDVSAIGRQRAAEQSVRQARQERPTGIVQADLNDLARRREVYERVAAKPESELPRIYRPKGGLEDIVSDPTEANVLLTDPNTGEIFMRGQSPKSFAQSYAGLGLESPVASQAMSALESGEDQMTGRVMRGVMRNEDLDASQINQIARQTGSAEVAASMTPDGVPVDQTDIPSPVATQQELAQSFLSQKRQELSSQFTPTRVERILGQNPELIEAAELYASTGDPNVLSRFSSAPSSPITVKPTVQMGINAEEFPTGQFYKKTGHLENTGDLLERDIELTNKISSLDAQQQQLRAKGEELGEQELMLRVAMDRDPEGGGYYTKQFGKVKFQQENLPNPASLNVDIGDALAERDFVRRQISSLESLGSTYKLGNFQEGVRPFYEYDPQGNIIPETLELRAGRPSVDIEPKTGGGRLVGEYDPEGQTGSTRGIYGVEQTSRRSGSSTRPTQMTMNELVREGLEQAAASPEGDVPIPPSLEQMTERRPTSVARRSIDASQIVRQAIIEGRDPQMVLRQRGFNV